MSIHDYDDLLDSWAFMQKRESNIVSQKSGISGTQRKVFYPVGNHYLDEKCLVFMVEEMK
jgi:hypothetical protein